MQTLLGVLWSLSTCVLLSQLASTAPVAYTFLTGIVLGSSGDCAASSDIDLGFRFFQTKAAAGFSFQDATGSIYSFGMQYTRMDEPCNQANHTALLQQLITQQDIQFVYGSGPQFAVSESTAANSAARICYHCCVEGNAVYDMGLKYVFGLAAPTSESTFNALKSMALLGTPTALMIAYRTDDLDASTSCQAALNYTNSLSKLNPAFQLVKVLGYTAVDASAVGFYTSLANIAAASGINAVIACDTLAASYDLGAAFGQQLRNGLPLTAVFMTQGPGYANFTQRLGDYAEYILSGVQWHPTMSYKDGFFGTAADYATQFTTQFGTAPSYMAAAASATAYTLALAISLAFTSCDVSRAGGDSKRLLFNASAISCMDSSNQPITITGYELVRQSLAALNVNTFFGPVAFNRQHQNTAKWMGTVQILDGQAACVLPLDAATKALVMPLPVVKPAPTIYGLPKWVFAVIIVLSVIISALILAFAYYMCMARRRSKVQVHSIFNIPFKELSVIIDPVVNTDTDYEVGKAVFKGAYVSLCPVLELPRSWSFEGSITRPHRRHSTATMQVDSRVDMSTRPSMWDLISSGTAAAAPASPHVAGASGAPAAAKAAAGAAPEREASKPLLQAMAQASGTPRLSLKGNDSSLAFMDMPTGQRPHSMRAFSREFMRPAASRLSWLGSMKNNAEAERALLSQLVVALARLQHPNIVPIIGVCWDYEGLHVPLMVTQYEEFGTLGALLDNQMMDLDIFKKADIAMDVASGLKYLHAQTPPLSLKSLHPNRILLDKRFKAKLLVDHQALPLMPNLPSCLQECDNVAMFGVLLSQLYTGLPAIADMNDGSRNAAKRRAAQHNQAGMEPAGAASAAAGAAAATATASVAGSGPAHMLVQAVRPAAVQAAAPPAAAPAAAAVAAAAPASSGAKGQSAVPAQALADLKEISPLIGNLVEDCVRADADMRPDFSTILDVLVSISKRPPRPLSRMNSLARSIAMSASGEGGDSHHSARSRTSMVIHNFRNITDDLLYEVFPPKVAEALKAGREMEPEQYHSVSVLFIDVVGYTTLCSELQPHEVMDMLHRLYSKFDRLVKDYLLFKGETIGDAYLAVANLLHPQPDDHARRLTEFAFEAIKEANATLVHPLHPSMGFIDIRVGLHVGPVVASVVGTINRRYCLFGDTVNLASRMESTSQPNQVQCTKAFATLLSTQWPQVVTTSRGMQDIKGKGTMETFFLTPPAAVQACHPTIHRRSEGYLSVISSISGDELDEVDKKLKELRGRPGLKPHVSFSHTLIEFSTINSARLSDAVDGQLPGQQQQPSMEPQQLPDNLHVKTSRRRSSPGAGHATFNPHTSKRHTNTDDPIDTVVAIGNGNSSDNDSAVGNGRPPSLVSPFLAFGMPEGEDRTSAGAASGATGFGNGSCKLSKEDYEYLMSTPLHTHSKAHKVHKRRASFKLGADGLPLTSELGDSRAASASQLGSSRWTNSQLSVELGQAAFAAAPASDASPTPLHSDRSVVRSGAEWPASSGSSPRSSLGQKIQWLDKSVEDLDGRSMVVKRHDNEVL